MRQDVRKTQGGYVAIMTTIIISLILLSLIAAEGFAGWHARFTAQSREKKEQANALAKGCMKMVLASLIKNPSSTDISFTTPSGTCTLESVDVSDPHAAAIYLKALVGSAETGGLAFTHLRIMVDFGDIHLDATPLESQSPGMNDLSVTLISVQEIP